MEHTWAAAQSGSAVAMLPTRLSLCGGLSSSSVLQDGTIGHIPEVREPRASPDGSGPASCPAPPRAVRRLDKLRPGTDRKPPTGPRSFSTPANSRPVHSRHPPFPALVLGCCSDDPGALRAVLFPPLHTPGSGWDGGSRVGQFIQKEQCLSALTRLHVLQPLNDEVELVEIIGIGAVKVLLASLIAKTQPGKQAVETPRTR